MAIIQYGKSAFTGNARTRRHRRRQPLARLNRTIDNALGLECDDVTLRTAERICQRDARTVKAPVSITAVYPTFISTLPVKFLPLFQF